MRIIKNKIASEKILVFIALLSRAGSNIIIFFLLALIFSEKEFGELLLFFTISTILACVVEYGLSTLILSKSNQPPAEIWNLYQKIELSRIYLAALALTIYIFIISIWPLPEGQEWSLSIAARIAIFLASILFISAQTAETVLRATGRTKTELASAITGNSIFLACVICSSLYFNQIDATAFSMLAGRAIHFASSSLRTQKYEGKINRKKTNKGEISFLKENKHFAIQSLAATAYLQIDSIIIGYQLDPSSVGNYQIFFRIALGLGIIADASASIKLKTTVAKMARGDQMANAKAERSKEIIFASLVTTIALILMIGLMVALDRNYLFAQASPQTEERFSLVEQGILSIIFAALVFVRFLAAHLGAELTAHKMQHIRSNGAILAFCIITLMCLTTIPILGITGAGIANLCGNIFIVYFYANALK